MTNSYSMGSPLFVAFSIIGIGFSFLAYVDK